MPRPRSRPCCSHERDAARSAARCLAWCSDPRARAAAAAAGDRELGRDRRADPGRARAARGRRPVRPRHPQRRPPAGRGRADGHRRARARTCSYDGPVIHPRIDELLENVDSRYAIVIVAAKRARQINNYHHQLGEGTFDDNPPPLVESRSKNYLTMALEEVAQGKLKYDYSKTKG